MPYENSAAKGFDIMTSPEGSYTLDFVGSSFKEKVVEFFLMVSGKIFYHAILRPMEYFRSRKKKNRDSNNPAV